LPEEKRVVSRTITGDRLGQRSIQAPDGLQGGRRRSLRPGVDENAQPPQTRIPPFLSRGTSDCGPEQNTDTVGQGQAEGTTDHQAPARAHWGGTRDLG